MDIPLYYIAFRRNSIVEEHYRKHGFKYVYHFPAVNGRKLSIKKMIDDGILSIRSQDDLKYGRSEHSGLPSLGAVGCTLSHFELWTMCVNRNMPYIIIAEEDNRMKRKLTSDDLTFIHETITQMYGVFISSRISITGKNKTKVRFFGTHFYIANQNACRRLAENTFPISVQTDWYMSDLATRNYIQLRGRVLSDQKHDYFWQTSIQDLCITCWLPRNKWFYIIFILWLIIMFISLHKRQKYIN